jgi:hypothetical protein
MACRSWVGFQEPSKITTRFAAGRLMPREPAFVEMRTHLTSVLEGSLNLRVMFFVKLLY